MSKIEDKIIEIIAERTQLDDEGKKLIKLVSNRAEVGLKKYGVTMEDAELKLTKWIQHAIEELLDAAIYLQKILTILTRNNGSR